VSTGPIPDPTPLQWTDELVERFWSYRTTPIHQYFAEQAARPLLRRIKGYAPANCEALDYGCGTGHLIPALLKADYFVTATDYSDKAVMAANERFRQDPRFRGAWSIAELLELKKQFSLVFLLEVIEHLSDAALEDTLTRLERLTAPGGLLVVTTPNEENLYDSHVYCPTCNHTFHRMQHVRSWSPKSLTAFLKARGFETLNVACTDLALENGSWLLRLKFAAKRRLRRATVPNLVLLARRSSAVHA
jgi:2-polyprenyl-3-methyl-5-hydroxy-6-metoxy-1,4-benzoquinol methylase